MARRSRTSGTCDHVCPGGRACYCNAQYRHVYHICGKSNCFCHTRAAYEGEQEERGFVVEVEGVAWVLPGEMEHEN